MKNEMHANDKKLVFNFEIHTMHVLDGAVSEIIWMKVLVPRSSRHFGLGVTQVKLTATHKTRITQARHTYTASVSVSK